MNASAIIFYVISAFILGAGLLAVTSGKIFRSAIWLLSTLVGIAALYFWMQVEFIAAVQIVVYVGGIVVLIIFSIFLTQESGKDLPKPEMKKVVFSILAALFGFGFCYNLISQYGFTPRSKQAFTVSVGEMGTQMLSTTEHGYILPFEVVSILLLAAMIGCIVIALKPAEQKPAEPKEVEQKELTPTPTETVVISETVIEEEVVS
ncbi:MAG TPA: NADH-quinone oxidoreductase subunit J [Flavisolibacter sp.]|nr:NADH-quinone oxidoreductase subunit J [Flavisolibacter sp.]